MRTTIEVERDLSEARRLDNWIKVGMLQEELKGARGKGPSKSTPFGWFDPYQGDPVEGLKNMFGMK